MTADFNALMREKTFLQSEIANNLHKINNHKNYDDNMKMNNFDVNYQAEIRNLAIEMINSEN